MAHKNRIRVHIEGREYSVVGGSFNEMLAAVKQINGRRFVSELKVWQLPGTVEDVQHQLEISGYYLEGGTPVTDTSPADQTLPSQLRGDRIRIIVQGHQLAVVGGTFQDMLAAIKSLPGRRFDKDAKIWEIPGELAVIKGMLQVAGFELEGVENIPLESVPPMELPPFSSSTEPDLSSSPSEQFDFFGHDDPFPFETPTWEEDDLTPPPPNPPDWWDDELVSPPDDYPDDEITPFEPESFPFEAKPSVPPPTVASAGRPGGDRIRIRVGAVPLIVTGGSFQEMLTVIKNIPGRRFNGQEKVWEIPDDVGLAAVKQIVNAAGFMVEPG
jgi:hypothetical protein